MSPRTKEQNLAIREERKKLILQTAAKLFLQRGTGMDIRDVAQAAQIGYGTVYHYYNNKTLLLHDVLENGFEQAEAAAAALLADKQYQSPLAQLEHYLTLLPATWREHTSGYIVYKLAADQFNCLDAETRLMYNRRFNDSLYGPLAAVIDNASASGALSPGLKANKTANTLIGSLIGATAFIFIMIRRRSMQSLLHGCCCTE